MPQSQSVALFDDRVLVRDCVTALLASAGVHVAVASGTSDEFFAGLAAAAPAVAVLVFHSLREAVTLPAGERRMLEVLRDNYPGTATVVMSPNPSLAPECRALGAVSFVDTAHDRAADLARMVCALSRGERPADISSALRAAAAGPTSSPLAALSTREREVLRWVSSGADNLKIASNLAITERTVKAHVSAIYRKLGAENRAQLALFARQLGVRPPGEL